MAPPDHAAIFLDRDGVLNDDPGYVHRVDQLVVLPGVPAALAALKRRGYLLVVITNQSGVGRGFYQEADVMTFNAALATAIIQAGGPPLDAVYYCPHHPDAGCVCRKPLPGLLVQAATEHGIALTRSFMVGDKPDDVECAVRAGATGIQVTRKDAAPHALALAQVASLADALPFIRDPA